MWAYLLLLKDSLPEWNIGLDRWWYVTVVGIEGDTPPNVDHLTCIDTNTH